jgi:hypothetical protein
LLLSIEDGDGDVDADVDDDEQRRYKKSSPKDWMMHVNRDRGQDVEPIPYHGLEKFQPNVTEEELMVFMDEWGDL